MIRFVCNDSPVESNCPGGLPVLDWIRGGHGLRGTKEGCREGDCGACTVVLGKPAPEGMMYSAVCSCLLPMAAVHGCHLVTIEGISPVEGLTPFQQAIYDHGASQCGFCTPGMVMSLTGFLLGERELTLENAMESLDGNICRCTGYASVRRAVTQVMQNIPGSFGSRLEMLIGQGHVPAFFTEIPGMLSSIPGREGPEGSGRMLAGGTDIYVHPTDELTSAEPVFLSIPCHIHETDGLVTVGAGATVEAIRESPVIRRLFPELDGFLGRVASTQIRARATLGGNVMNGSPIGDLAVLFLALGAVVRTRLGEIPLNRFYRGYKEFAVGAGEILLEFVFPAPEKGAVLSALKVCRREYLDIASVNSAALLRIVNGVVKEASIAAGGVYPYPLHLEGTSRFLQGKRLTEGTIAGACGIASGEISPISDVRGSKEYKTELLKAQIRAHLTQGDHQ